MSAIALSAEHVIPPMTHTLLPENINPLRGNSYAYVIPRPTAWPLLRTIGDTHDNQRSHLVLFEDGKSLAYPHAYEPSIDSRGRGRYIHMRDDELYFATSDNSDPRRNERVYTLSVPLTPSPDIAKFFLVAMLIVGSAWLLATPKHRMRVPGGTTTIAFFFIIYAAIWQWLILDDIPRIIDSGDGGVVAGIAAAKLWPERFLNDIVYGDPKNFSFYQTISIPYTMLLTKFTGDIGTSYAMLALPLVFFQLVGFYLVGRQFSNENIRPTLLAILSTCPVYVMSGELWGSLPEPITRYTFNALFPFLLLVAMPPAKTWKPFATMGLCGVGIYFHSVSAPSVALALWIALAFQRPPPLTWPSHIVRMILAGLVFVASAIPFALGFLVHFQSSKGEVGSNIAAEVLRVSVGEQYTNVIIGIRAFLRFWTTTQNASYGWLWLIVTLSLATLLWSRRKITPTLRVRISFLGLTGLGIIIASFGLTAVDQTLAWMRGGYPLQMDLVRNIRFIVPIALILTFAGSGWLSESSKWRSTTLLGTGALASLWLLTYTPLPLHNFARILNGGPSNLPGTDSSARRALAELARANSAKPVLVLPRSGASELLGLAVRYGGRQPAIFLDKDINLLSYSASPRVSDWMTRRQNVTALESTTDVEQAKVLLREMVERYDIGFILLHEDVRPTLATAATSFARPVVDRGKWQLFAVTPQ